MLELSPDLPIVMQPADTLRRDFYETYRFSQGMGRIHWRLASLVAAEYRASWEPEDLAAVPDAMSDLEERITGTLKPPKEHRHYPLYKTKETRDNWRDFGERIAGNREPVHKGETPHLELLIETANEIAERDLYYMTRTNEHIDLPPGRPLPADTTHDRHESYFREYVLRGMPTNSQAFDTIFEAMRWHMLGRRRDPPLFQLPAAWRQHHPGKRFYPERAASLLCDMPVLYREYRRTALHMGSLLHLKPSLGIVNRNEQSRRKDD